MAQETPKADAVWAAMRSMHEGEPATLERLALISNRMVGTLRARCEAEGWRADAVSLTPDERHVRLQALSDRLLVEMEKEGRRGGEAQAGAKARIDEILASLRTLEKFADISRQTAGAQDQQEGKSDARIAGILDRLHRQMLAMARHYADGMVAQRVQP